MTRPSLPPGWPGEVQPPGTAGWERSAMAWLFDQCPPDYRGYDVLRRHPVVLARFAATALDAAVDAADSGLHSVRSELRGRVEPGQRPVTWDARPDFRQARRVATERPVPAVRARPGE